MTNPEQSSWPKLFRRLSLTGGSDKKDKWRGTLSQDPQLPIRPTSHLYQPQDIWTDNNRQDTFTEMNTQDISYLIEEQQRLFDEVKQNQHTVTRTDAYEHHGSTGSAKGSLKADVDAKPPTTDRVAEFRLVIPDGVRNMTQHPGDRIVGSVVITVTKPTKGQRIRLHFLGHQRVHLKDPTTQSPIPSFVVSEYKLFDKRLVIWGDKSLTSVDVLSPGTLTIPFSIKLPQVNYPSSMKRESVCKVKYLVWAEFERPGTFKDHVMRTHREEIHIEPYVYPTRPYDSVHIASVLSSRQEGSAAAHLVAVRMTAMLSSLPVVAGDCISYRVEASTVPQDPSKVHSADLSKYVVKQARIVIVEKLDVSGLIQGVEYPQHYRTDIFTTAMPPALHKDNSTFISNGEIRVPLDLCPFDGKQLSRRYELRFEFDVVDSGSLLDKVIRQTSTYDHLVPLEVCTISPNKFSREAYQNAYADESLNISNIALPSHYSDPSEPRMRIGGWELERSFAKWDSSNPTWIAMAKKKGVQ
ncbi:hypothetical protein LPJ73_002225 [Coemansia sp. RSA 2703]|nr:hypothetical protein LPJ73_002225 [Coemansia sp. RSA 2703]KAJ2371897.1 hypothetical protein IW150_004381 [Coemansia sp. RSA 2607]